MAKILTNTLTGAALDWAANRCDGFTPKIAINSFGIPVLLNGTSYSTSGDEAIALLSRFPVSLEYRKDGTWDAHHRNEDGSAVEVFGAPTPIVAIARCWVTFKFGEEIDIPDELLPPGKPSPTKGPGPCA